MLNPVQPLELTVLEDILKARYATKKFDASRTLNDDVVNLLKKALYLSPSSVNLQPWHFILLQSAEAKQKLAAACTGEQAYNASKIIDAPFVALLCAKNDMGNADVDALIAQEYQDGRYKDEASKQARTALIQHYVEKINPSEKTAWIDKQCYIALGQLLLAAASLGLDSVAIEGFDKAYADKAFDLAARDLHSVVIAAIGYAYPEDFNQQLPKSRFSETVIFTHL